MRFYKFIFLFFISVTLHAQTGPVDWGSFYGCELRGDTLITTSAYEWSHAVSKNTLAGGTDGWFEYVLKGTDQTKEIGFLDSLSPNLQDVYDMDYGFYYQSNGYLYKIVEGGWTVIATSSPEGTVLRGERIGDTITLKVNGVQVASLVKPSDAQKDWKLKGIMHISSNSSLINVGCSFYQKGNTVFPNYTNLIPSIVHSSGLGLSDGSISVTGLQSGSYIYTWQLGSLVSSSITAKPKGAYRVTAEDPLHHKSSQTYNIGYKSDWGSLYGCELRGDTLITTSSYEWSQAVSRNTLAGGTDGWFEYILKGTDQTKEIGFLDSLSPNLQDVYDIDYGFYYQSNGYLYKIVEGGWTVIATSPPEGTVLRGERIGDTITLKVNGVQVASLVKPFDTQKTWKLKGIMHIAANSSLINVGCSFYQKGNTVFPNYTNLIPSIVHSSGIGLSDGSIHVTPRQSDVYAYSWQPGSAISSSILSIPFGTYNLTVSDPIANQSLYTYNIGYKVQWTNVINGYFRNDTISGVSSACSKNTLLPNEDGWVEYVQCTPGNYFIGFTDSLSLLAGDVTDIDYGIYSYASTYLYTWETNTNVYIGNPQVGDIVRVERIGNVINYKINNVLMRSVTVPGLSQKTLKLHCNFNPGSMLVNVGCSFMHTNGIAFKNYVSVRPVIRHSTGPGVNDGSIRVLPDLSTLSSYTWSPSGATTSSLTSLPFGTYTVNVQDNASNQSPYQYNVGYKVQWDTLFAGGTFTNDTLSGPVNSKSKNVLLPNTDGWVEYIFTGGDHYIGFADTISSAYGLSELDYGIYCYAGIRLYSVEGANMLIIGGPRLGDRIKIERIGNVINYRINDVIAYTSTAIGVSSKKLKLMTSVSYGVKLVNVGCSFATEALSATIIKEHSDYDNPYSGIIAVAPNGGSTPYITNWAGLTGNDPVQTGLYPGTYNVTLTDARQATVVTPVSIGLKNQWRIKKNISVVDEDYTNTLVNSDSAATLVSYNTIPSRTNGWTELAVTGISQNLSFGFLGFSSNDLDNNYTVPYPREESVKLLLRYTDSLLYQRFVQRQNGTYPPKLPVYNSIHLINLKDGHVSLNLHGLVSATEITYQVGDVFRLARSGDTLKLYKNEQKVYAEVYAFSSQQLVNTLLVTSRTAKIRSVGGFASMAGLDYGHAPLALCTEPNLNWVRTASFDENEVLKSESKVYMDMLGRTIQSQTKLFTENNVLVSEPLYDAYGRAIGQTLPAPSFNSGLCYVTNFAEVTTNNPYTYTSFDNAIGVPAPGKIAVNAYNAPGDINHPLPLNNTTQGKLGWYYSDNNTVDNFTAADQYPYTRVEYDNDPLNRTKRAAGVGENHFMGSNHETKFIYTSTPAITEDPLTNELNFVFPYRTYELEKDFSIRPLEVNYNLQLFKTISINPDGKDQITYTNSGGQTIATCITGDGSGCVTHTEVKVLYTPGASKTIETIYIPKLKAGTFKFYELNGTTKIYSNIVPSLIDAQTNISLVSGTDYTYNTSTGVVTFLGAYSNRSLYLQLGFSFLAASNNNVLASVDVDYTQWTLYFYDRKGRLLANAAPNEVICQKIPYAAQRTVQKGGTPGTCDPNASVTEIILNQGMTSATNKEVVFTFNHTFDPIFSITANTSNFVFKTQTQKNQEDSIYLANNPFVPFNDTLAPPSQDTVISPLLDSLGVDQYTKLNALYTSVPTYALAGKKVTYEGSYALYARLQNNTEVKLETPSIPFKFSITAGETSPVTGGVVMKNGGPDDIPMKPYRVPPLVLPNGIAGIRIKVQTLNLHPTGFGKDDIAGESPCHGDIYNLNPGILNSLNAAVHLNVSLIGLTNLLTPIPLTLANKYMYDEFDRLIGSESQDEGRVDYVYDQEEDKLLCTQNDKQRAQGGKFSCIVYDKLGRVVTTGEYDPNNGGPTGGGAAFQFQTYDQYFKNPVPVASGRISIGVPALANTSAYNDGHIFDRSFVEYDQADDQLPVTMANTGYTQKYTAAKVSKTYNDHTTTWYSYDELGRQTWSVQNSTELGYKTMDYSYDFRGNLLQSIYQKNQGDNFYHAYTYDADERLKNAKYGRYITGDGLNMSSLADYSYYLHGPLKRVVLGGNLQGLDYVYTIGGMLKSVNNPMSALSSSDPGLDGYATGPNATVSPDAFGYTLQYYANDYKRTASPVKSYNYTGSFNPADVSYGGLIKNMLWRTSLPATAPANYSNALLYEYKYNELYQLTDARMGTAAPSSGNNAAVTALPEYKVENLTYDPNGNLKTAKRYAAPSTTGAAHLLDDLSYVYQSTKKNRLVQVADAAVNTAGYTADLDLPTQTNAANYTYNEIGEMASNLQENRGYEYNASGLTTRVYNLANNNTVALFTYNDKGLRHSKTSYNTSGVAIKDTYYSYDAGGAQVASYTKDLVTAGAPAVIQDFTLYGAGRHGIMDMTTFKAMYELTDHLGNTRAVISKNNTTGLAETISYTDYFPHGAVLPGRNFVTSSSFRFGYQGQENDPETGLISFELRQYDPRISRWNNPDPMGQHHSPYLAMGNNPVSMVDPDGGWDGGYSGDDGFRDYMFNTGGGNPNTPNWMSMSPHDRQTYQTLNGTSYEAQEGNKRLDLGSLGGWKSPDGTVYHLVNNQWGYYETNTYYQQDPSYRAEVIRTRTSRDFITVQTVNVIIHHGSNLYDGAAGGRMGGHVMINFGDNNVYGFTGWGVKDGNGNNQIEPDEYKEVPLFPSRSPYDPSSWFSSIHGNDYYGDMATLKSGKILDDGTEVSAGATSIFSIPVSSATYNGIKSFYENNLGKSPYPYTQFGMRCASSVYSALKVNRAIKANSPLNKLFNAFGPGFLFRYLNKQGFSSGRQTITNFTGIESSQDGFNMYNIK